MPAPRRPTAAFLTALGVGLAHAAPAATAPRPPARMPRPSDVGSRRFASADAHLSGGGGNDSGEALLIVLPLIILLATMVCVLVVFAVLVIILRRNARIALSDTHTPADILNDEEDVSSPRVRQERQDAYLSSLDDASRQGFFRSQAWARTHPEGSVPSEITLAQFLSIQEKGVLAWSFEPDYESNPPLYVQGRTEITFLADGDGLAPQEGGAVCVQSNLPIPKLNEVYYFEIKMFNKPDTTNVAIGLATKPYPSFRLPGLLKYSVGYFSLDGTKCHNQPWSEEPYSVPYRQGDVIGLGYRPRQGSVFFTRNGKRFSDAFVGLHKHNFFPTVAADGPAEVHVNFGQVGFVFIEANVKKWGLAPMVGNLPPPPAYGAEGGNVLIQTADDPGSQSAATGPVDPTVLQSLPPPPPISPLLGAAEALSAPLEGRMTPHLLPPAATSSRVGRQAQGQDNAEDDDDGMSISSGPSFFDLPTPRASGMDISLHSLPSPENFSQTHPPHSSRPGTPAPAAHGMTSHTTTRATPRDYAAFPNTPPPYSPFPSGSTSRGVWSSIWGWMRPNGTNRGNAPPPAAVTGSGSLRFHPEANVPSSSGSRGPPPETASDASRVPSRPRTLASALVNSLDQRGLFEPLHQTPPFHPSAGPRVEPPPLLSPGIRPSGSAPLMRRPSSAQSGQDGSRDSGDRPSQGAEIIWSSQLPDPNTPELQRPPQRGPNTSPSSSSSASENSATARSGEEPTHAEPTPAILVHAPTQPLSDTHSP